MSFKLGMPTLIEFKSIEENINLCKSLGLDFIEMNMDLPYCVPENISESTLQFMKNSGLGFSIHFPEDADFACIYPEIRTAYLNLLINTAEWASKLDVKVINIHINEGVYFTLPDRKAFIYKDYFNSFKENLYKSVDEIEKISKQYNIKICFENTKIQDFIKEVFIDLSKRENTFFTWDVGHDAKDDYRASQVYNKFLHKVKHMHLHDYDGKSNHQVLYTGTLEINKYLKFAEQNNLMVVVETKTAQALEESIGKLRR